MKKHLLAVGMFLTATLSAWPQDRVGDAWARLSKLQSYIEYVFMETGAYPASLDEMEDLFSRAPRGTSKIALPLDPATNKPFKYAPDQTRRHYTLTVPDPAAYGGARIAVKEVEWGYLADLADLRRYEQVVRQSGNIMKALATQCELYAKDHQRQYPNSFDELMPKYIQRHPTDPMTGKNFVYRKMADGYLIDNPNPERYGLKTFRYDSRTGLVVEQAQPAKAPQPGAAPAPAPPSAPAPAPAPAPPPQ